MLYLICTMISSVDLAHYRVSRAKDWVSVDCGTKQDKKTYCYYNSSQKNIKKHIKVSFHIAQKARHWPADLSRLRSGLLTAVG